MMTSSKVMRRADRPAGKGGVADSAAATHRESGDADARRAGDSPAAAVAERPSHSVDVSVLAAVLDNMDQGLVVYDHELVVLACNERAREILNIPPDQLRPGADFANVIRFAAERGDYGPGDPGELFEKYHASAQGLAEHRLQRTLADGRTIEVRATPRPGGGFIATYTDITEHKQAEQALRDSETRYRALVDRSPDALIVHQDGIVVFANESAVAMFGAGSIDDLLGMEAIDLAAPEERDTVRQRRRSMIADRQPLDLRIAKYQRLDGTIFLGESGPTQFVWNGAPAVLIVIRDLSERERAEAIRLESEQRFKDFARAASDWLWELDENLRYTYISDAPVSGQEAAAINGRTRWEVAGVDPDTDPVWGHHRDMMEARQPFRDMQFRVMGGDGMPHYLRASGTPVFDAKGDFKGYRGVTTEVTAEVEAHDRLAQADARLRDAIESIADGFILFDAQDRAVMWNQRFVELYPELSRVLEPGVTAEALFEERYRAGAVGQFDVSPEEYVAWRMQVRRASDGSPAVHRHADGRWFRTTERDTSDGGIVAISTDVTEIKLREQQLQQAHKMEAVGRLTGGIAHDFNNLLTVMQGNLEILKEDIAGSPHLKRVDAALGAAGRGADLTQHLLAFSRQVTLKPVSIDLPTLLTDFAELLRHTFDETISIEVETEDGLWWPRTDLNQIENALLNLAINARDAMPKGGRITISAANSRVQEQVGRSHLDLSPGNYVVISVRDTGTGMSQEVLEHAFEPFFTTKEVGAGSGLGLSMVYGFANQSGGRVEIDSRTGEGTTVRLWLPRAPEFPVASSRQDEAGLACEGEGQTILVVEDDLEVRQLTVAMLNNLGYRTIEAEDGPSAVEILASGTEIDLLFTDVVLPRGMSGPDVAREAHRRRPDVRIVYTSGYAPSKIGDLWEFDTDVDLLEKPFKKSELARRIAAALDE